MIEMHLAHNRGRRYVRYLLGVVLCVATVATSQGGDGRSPLYFPRTLSGSGSESSPLQLLGTQTSALSRHCTWHLA